MTFKIYVNHSFLLFLLVISYSSQYLILPFKILKNRTDPSILYSSALLNDHFYNPLLINISISGPNKYICALLDTNTDRLSFENNYIIKNLKNNYNKEDSNTYKLIGKYELTDSVISETLIFYNDLNNFNNKISVEDIYIIEKNNYDKNNNVTLNLGIKVKNINNFIKNNISNKKIETNLIIQLKKKNIISSTNFYVKYEEIIIDSIKYDGYIVIGEEPHAYTSNKNILNENDLVKTTCGNEFGEFNWYITFDEIFFYNTTNNDTEINQSNDTIFVNYQRVIYSKAKISPNLGLIISTNDYFYEIEKIFFQKLYDKGVCYTSYISGYKFDIIYCLTSMIESNELESFPSLHFKNFIFNYDFELTYKDLFFEQGKYTFFSIIRQSTFRIEENDFDIGSKWEFGLPFLKKYFLTFDYDNRLIGFYKQTNQNKNVYNVGSENTGAKVMTIIILCILFAMICFLCSRRIFKKRRSFNDDKDSFAIKKPYIASELLNYYEK